MQIIADAVRDLKTLYVELYLFLPKTSNRSNEPIVSGTRDERKVPLKLNVEALMREIVDVAVSWHEHVADVTTNASQRPGVLLNAAVKDLVIKIPTLARLENTTVVRDGALVDMSGVQACLELLRLRARARKVLGIEQYIETREAPCPSCGAYALTRASGESDSRCEECARCVSEKEYDQWCKELLGITD